MDTKHIIEGTIDGYLDLVLNEAVKVNNFSRLLGIIKENREIIEKKYDSFLKKSQVLAQTEIQVEKETDFWEIYTSDVIQLLNEHMSPKLAQFVKDISDPISEGLKKKPTRRRNSAHEIKVPKSEKEIEDIPPSALPMLDLYLGKCCIAGSDTSESVTFNLALEAIDDIIKNNGKHGNKKELIDAIDTLKYCRERLGHNPDNGDFVYYSSHFLESVKYKSIEG